MDNSERGGFCLGTAADEGLARWNLTSEDSSAWPRQARYADAASSREANRRSRDLQL